MPIEPPRTAWLFPDLSDPKLDALHREDLVGRGANLDPGTLLQAYRAGLFPMPDPDGGPQVLWWSPVERGVLPLADLRVPRSLAKSARRFEIRLDTAFEEVVAACGDPGRTDGQWITDDIAKAYAELHRLGWAHSVEAWRDGELAGGLYGVAIGGLFAGESMFHRERDASKVALVGLVDVLRDTCGQDRLLDVQWRTSHLASLGVSTLPRREYLHRLAVALELPLPVAFWTADH